MRAYVAPWSNRALVAIVVATTIGGVGLLLLAWRSDVESRRMRDAPQCAPSQVFTPAKCRAELDGTLTELTTSLARVDVAGRHLVMTTIISQNVPPAGGRPVRVTLYRGKVILIEADHLSVESNDTPEDDRMLMSFLGVFLLIAGPANVVRELARRPRGGGPGRPLPPPADPGRADVWVGERVRRSNVAHWPMAVR